MWWKRCCGRAADAVVAAVVVLQRLAQPRRRPQMQRRQRPQQQQQQASATDGSDGPPRALAVEFPPPCGHGTPCPAGSLPGRLATRPDQLNQHRPKGWPGLPGDLAPSQPRTLVPGIT
ncbi:hypothetical protein PLESTB_000842100 [Pleodorina starrii]|uniref:Uncharacterized protein n=1 Tax=Pleodorina starrii TaxID=330485 RepID=A0A9W6BLA4_9CHLO|nr:hypothetical protein PLESTM_000157900 [Pleodorina starrii]GLC54272.1 hypothetical protein PLESTB_000842100 [Pleodorina starrii]GLC64427.1 hypothetical protein PLESTF_000164800 [Pleodorina starrii]